MKLKFLILIFLLLVPQVASAKIIGDFSGGIKKTLSLDEAKANTNKVENQPIDGTILNNTNGSESVNVTTPVSTETPQDPLGVMLLGQQMISGGIKMFISSIADSFLTSGYGIQTQNLTQANLTGSQTLVFDVAGYKLNPYDAPPVQNIIKKTYGLFCVVALIILLGAYCWVIVQHHYPGFASELIESVTGSEKYFDFSSFLHVWIILVGWASFAIFAVEFILTINDVIVAGQMSDIIGQVSLNSQNLPLYFVMTIGYFIMSIWVFMRIVFVYLIAAYVLILGLMFAWPLTRPLAKVVMVFFIGIVAMQPIMIAVISFCVAIVNGVSWLAPLASGIYAGGILILTVVCFLIMFWPVIYISFRLGVAQKAITLIGV